MPPTASMVDVTDAVKALIDASLVPTPFAASYYGDTGIIPTFPSVEVRSGTKDREIRSTHQYRVSFTVEVLVHYGMIQDPAINTREDEVLAEQVEVALNADPTLGGLVHFGFVIRLEPGASVRGRGPERAVLRTTRVVWQGFSTETF